MTSVEILEARVDHLEDEVRALRQVLVTSKPHADWRKTVGEFADDPGFQELVREGAELRTSERHQTGEPC